MAFYGVLVVLFPCYVRSDARSPVRSFLVSFLLLVAMASKLLAMAST